jgi:twinkle protein
MKNVDDFLVTEKEVSGYMNERDNGEHLKIKKPSDYADEVEKFFSEDVHGGTPLPFDKTLNDFRVRLGELSIVSGYSGHGKTAWLSYVMLHLMRQHKTLIASFEMLPKATLGRMCMQSDNPDPTPVYIQDFLAGIENRLYLYDANGETSAEKVLEVIYYGAEKLDVKLFVIDSLMKCGINEDDLNGQKAFANKLAVAARDLGIHIFLVAHSRKTADESGSPSKFDVAGSANITNLADNSISVHRNKKKEIAIRNGEETDDVLSQPDCVVYLNKQRHGNGTETRWGFWFDARTFRYKERP